MAFLETAKALGATMALDCKVLASDVDYITNRTATYSGSGTVSRIPGPYAGFNAFSNAASANSASLSVADADDLSPSTLSVCWWGQLNSSEYKYPMGKYNGTSTGEWYVEFNGVTNTAALVVVKTDNSINVASATGLTLNTWKLYTFQITGTTFRLYENTTLKGTNTYTGTRRTTTGTDQLTFGGLGGGNGMDAPIAAACLIPSAISTSDMQALIDASAHGFSVWRGGKLQLVGDGFGG